MQRGRAGFVMLACLAALAGCFEGSGGGDSSGGGAASGGTTGATGATGGTSAASGGTTGATGGTVGSGGTGAGGASAATGGMTGGAAGIGGVGGNGAAGGAGGVGGGSGLGGTGGASGAGGGSMCTPTCFRAYTCAASCDDEPFDNGCCTCPEGTIDTIGCPTTGAEGYCAVPCTGAAPDPSVEAACPGFTTQEACAAYEAAEFPYGCAWVVPPIEPCLAP